MATPTQSQPYTGTYSGQAAQGRPQSAYPTEGPPQSAGGQYAGATSGPSFDKYCVIHIATTCDEHGVYVTKDSAEVIEIGWVVVDARDPNLPEVCLL